MTVPFILLGGGGHALVVLETLEAMGQSVRAYCAPEPAFHLPAELDWIATDAALLALDPASVALACGLGSVGQPARRQALFERFAAAGFRFPAVRHPSATISPRALLGEGAQVMMGACLQPGTQVGRNAILNTGARIDHGCRIGDHAHVAPGAVLAGGVTLEEGVHVGAGATVLQGLTIGRGAVIGAGACVVGDVAAGATCIGVPARCVQRIQTKKDRGCVGLKT